MTKTLSLALLCLLLAAPAQAQELHRGMNLSSWIANAPRQPLYARDFAQLKQAGFDHLRLPWNPTYYGFKLDENAGDPSRIDFTPLDRAVALAEQSDLPVIIDLHVGGDFTDMLERHVWAEKQFVALWQEIALHFVDHPANAVIFELLNEPQYYHREDVWNRLAARSVEAIRAISPQRKIVIGAPHGSEIDGLPYLKTSDDPNLIYAFHFYEPYLVTHQGIHMGFDKKAIRYYRHMPYPSNLVTESADVYAPTAPSPGEARKELEEYIAAPWNAETIRKRIDLAKAWADKHHVKLLCGEFGVLRNHIDAESRYRWITDARAVMDADNIGWELWDYADLFGIASPVGASSTDPVDGSVTLNNPEKGSRLLEAAALQALGLKP